MDRGRLPNTDPPRSRQGDLHKRASTVSSNYTVLADLLTFYSVVMNTQFIIFYEEEEHYLEETGIQAFFKKSSRQIAEAFQSTAVYLDLARDLDRKTPLPFFKSKIDGAQLAYDRLKLELSERVGEEKVSEIEEQVLTAIKKERDESAG